MPLAQKGGRRPRVAGLTNADPDWCVYDASGDFATWQKAKTPAQAVKLAIRRGIDCEGGYAEPTGEGDEGWHE